MSLTDLLYSNDSGAGAGSASSYIQDAFKDISKPATNNTGLTSNSNTNPMGDYFGNDDVVRFQAKTLYFKDLVLEEDRSKWIGGQQTYRITFDNNFSPVHGYCFGTIDSSRGLVIQYNGGFGITGAVRRVQWIVNPAPNSTATAQLYTDGSATTTVDFSKKTQLSGSDNSNALYFINHQSSNETNNLHDFRIVALQNITLNVIGVVVYSENTGGNIQCYPGVTYNNKNIESTSTGATIAIPSYGSSLGGNALIYKSSSNTYLSSALSVTLVQSVGVGTINTNLVSVSAGQGSRFNAGDGFLINSFPNFAGTILSVSTDTLTVSPTLTVGVSQQISRLWSAGPTYAINASLMKLNNVLDFSVLNIPGDDLGLSTMVTYTAPDNAYTIWGFNFGTSRSSLTDVDAGQQISFGPVGASNFLQVEGYCSAAEVEWQGATGTILNATFTINGLPGWSINEQTTTALKQTIFTNAVPQWNTFRIGMGGSFGASLMAIKKINLYGLNKDIGVSFGNLASFDSLMSPVDRSPVSASVSSYGVYKRIPADSMYFYGTGASWGRFATFSVASGHGYASSVSGANARYDYYGTNFCILGLSLASVGTYTFDGGGSTSSPFNTYSTGVTLGFHSVVFSAAGSGVTAQITGFEYMRPYSELTNLQNKDPLPVTTNTGVINFDVYGGIPSGGQTGVIYYRVPKDISVYGTDLYIVNAGSTGITQVDVQYSSILSTSFVTMFATKPSANALSGSNYTSKNAALFRVPFSLRKDAVLRLDINSAQVGSNTFLLNLLYKEI